jgi:adenine-specific DNA-methyltransferase
MPFEEGSFDVVIGNPPYVALNKIKDVDYSRAGFEVFEKTGDLLALFIEKGLRLTADGKYFSFIVSNSWLKTKYGEPLKRFLENNGQTEVLNFVGTQLFEDATVESCIVNSVRFRHPELDSGSQIADQVRNDGTQSITITNIRNFTTQYASADTIVDAIENSKGDNGEELLMNRIETIGKPLKEWNVSINYGIKTGFNEAFIIDTVKRDELVARDSKSAEIIKPMLRGRDVQKYVTNWANIWLINPHNNPSIDINNYLVIKEHLDGYYEKLVKRSDQGKTPYNLRNCAYLADFEKPKIIWGEISDEPKFAYDDTQMYAEATTFFMTGENLKYLLAFLNSKLSKWYFERISTTTGMGTNRWKKFKLELLPIAIVEDETPFINLVDEILETKPKIKVYKTLLDEAIKNDNFDREIKLKKEIETMENRVIECEKEIDVMVYALYGLSEDEIAIVEGKND